MPSPRVSIVTIFLNARPFLAEAVESVRSQPYDSWELLLVDDGSDDGSTAIAQAYAAAEPDRIRYLQHSGHSNRGMSASRNLGLGSARGRYVTFLDADDTWAENPLDEQVSFLDENRSFGMIYAASLWWYSWTGKTGDASRDFIQETGAPPDTHFPTGGILKLILENEGWSPCGPLWRRSALEEVGGFDESFKGMYEDQVIQAKASLRWPAYLRSGSWYKYRKECGGCCSRSLAEGKYRKARLRYLHWLESHLKSQQVQDPVLWDLLRSRLFPVRHPLLHRVTTRMRRLPYLSKLQDCRT